MDSSANPWLGFRWLLTDREQTDRCDKSTLVMRSFQLLCYSTFGVVVYGACQQIAAADGARRAAADAGRSAASSMTEPTAIPIDQTSDEIAHWLWKNLVPKAGQSAWVQGELLRCIEKLCWEAQTNGNCNWDRGFRRIAKYLEEMLCNEPGFSEEVRQSIRNDVAVLRDYMHPYTEQDLYDRLTEHVVEFCRLRPVLIPKPHDPKLDR